MFCSRPNRQSEVHILRKLKSRYPKTIANESHKFDCFVLIVFLSLSHALFAALSAFSDGAATPFTLLFIFGMRENDSCVHFDRIDERIFL